MQEIDLMKHFVSYFALVDLADLAWFISCFHSYNHPSIDFPSMLNLHAMPWR